jgi:hypothetical protein
MKEGRKVKVPAWIPEDHGRELVDQQGTVTLLDGGLNDCGCLDGRSGEVCKEHAGGVAQGGRLQG